MKKKALLFILLIALFAPLAMTAQSVAIGDGTSTSQNLPANSYYNYAISQQIYTADEINASGNITSIAFYNAGIGTAANNARKFDIYMAHTTKTDFESTSDWIALTDSDIVYQGTEDVTLTPNTWTTFNLNTQFAYNGTDNLVVCVIDRSGDYTSSGNHNMYRVFSTGSEYQALYAQSDSYSSLTPDGHNSTSSLTGSRMTSKNQIILGGIQQTCAKPTNLAAALTPGDGTIATLSWTEMSEATSWVLQYGTDDTFAAGTYTEVTVNNTPSKDLTGLTAEQTYYARVKPDCDNNGTLWSTTCEFTPTDAYSVTVNDGTNTNGYVPIYGYYVDNSVGTRSQFIIPAADLAGMQWGIINGLTFYASQSSVTWGNAQFEVYMAEVDNTTFSSTSLVDWTTMDLVMNAASLSISGNQMVVALDAPYQYKGGNLMIGFKQTVKGSYVSCSWYGVSATGASLGGYSSTISQQNFLPKTTFDYEPGQAPSCLPPTGLDVVGTPTAHAVTVEWNAEVGETFNYAIELGTGIDPETVTYAGSITATETTCSMSWNTLMNDDSDYTVFIRKDCGNGDYSTAATKIIHTAIACPAPTNLAIADLTATSGTLTWTDNAEADQWELCFDGDEENLRTTNHTPSYPLTGFTAETIHTVKVRAVCGGNDGKSDWSAELSFEPTNKITIGEATSTSGYLPTNTNYDYSYSQQIYTVEELGEAGLIESIDFFMTSTTNRTRTLDIYMVGTDKNSFTTTDNSDWINVTDADLVFTGSVVFLAQTWTTITLDNPFIYDGTQNVAIIVDDNSGEWNGGSRYFQTYSSNAYQSHYYYRDSNNIDPNTAGNNGTVNDSKNQIRILKSDLNGCVAPTGLTATMNGPHSITVNWNQYGEVDHWTIRYQYVGETDWHQRTVYEHPYTFNDLQAATEYTFEVCANCDDTHSAWASSSVNATTDIACPAPTPQPVSSITNNSATISWTGSEAGSFNVRYRAIDTVYFESFEDGLPSDWTIIDADGDGYNWMASTEVGNFACHSGSVCMTSASYDNNAGALTPDNWLITPLLDLQGTMRVWLRGQDESEEFDANKEHFAIYLSTTGTTVDDFTVALVPETITTKVYTEYTADLSEYTGRQGYIAIRHFNITDQFYLDVDDFGIYDVGEWQTPDDSPVAASTITLTGLDAETIYEVEVQADCGNADGTSVWTNTIFTTLDNCALPYELNVTDLTTASATLNWTGLQDSYTMRYRKLTYGEPVTATEDFEHNGDMPEGWTMLDLGDGANTAELGISEDAAQNGTYGFRFSSYSGSSSGSFDQYLISPELPNITALSFAFKSSSGTSDKFRVGYSTTTNDVAAFTWGDETLSANSWTTYTEDPENIPANAKYFAINYTAVYKYRLYIDDITYTCISVTYGNWDETNTEVTSSLPINNLEMNTTYEWQVQGIDCDGNGTTTDWSESTNFTTLFGMTKEIVGYENGGGWYLIASPVTEIITPTMDNGFLTDPESDFDLFRFNEAADLEWVNWKNAGDNYHFDIENGKGYLYAAKNGTTLSFSGTPGSNGEVTLSKTEGSEFEGWNLVGNPLAETAYLPTDRDFYIMNNSIGEIVLADEESRSIEAMEAVFVIAEEDEETITFTNEQPTNEGKALALNLTQGRGIIDRAIVRFGQGQQLPKFQLRETSTKLYIPQNNTDYAVVYADNIGQMPLYFKAENNGSYTLSIHSKNIEFNYLHLIDNLTGDDIDLLQTSNYSFEANTNDDASRFNIVFRTDTPDPQLTQEISVTPGWNWWSTYLEMAGINGIQLLENALGDNGLQIKSQQAFTTNATNGWFGSLQNIDNESMYLINTDHASEHSITGTVANPANHTIYVNTGWNWIGYIESSIMDINEALTNLEATDEDIFKTQNGFATYYSNYGWYGELQNLQPGHGYMLLAHNATSFTYPTNAKGSNNGAIQNVDKYWKPVVGKYPSNMSVMAVIELNGNELRSEDVELAAFDHNGECRGAAKLQFVEPLNRYVAFLTVQGFDNDPLQFLVRNENQSYAVNETLTMKVDEVVGTAHNPFKMTLKGTMSIDDNNTVLGIFPNPATKDQTIRLQLAETTGEYTVEIIDMLGRTILSHNEANSCISLTTPEVAGVYTVRITDKQGNTCQGKLIVR